MKNILSILLILIFTNEAIASNMGNGPGMVFTWVAGGIISLVVALIFANEKDPENDGKEIFNTGKFK